jgi:hypothetical protein
MEKRKEKGSIHTSSRNRGGEFEDCSSLPFPSLSLAPFHNSSIPFSPATREGNPDPTMTSSSSPSRKVPSCPRSVRFAARTRRAARQRFLLLDLPLIRPSFADAEQDRVQSPAEGARRVAAQPSRRIQAQGLR